MSRSNHEFQALIIEPARDGGYVVKAVGHQNSIWENLFAGTLEGALDYMHEHFDARGHRAKQLPLDLQVSPTA